MPLTLNSTAVSHARRLIAEGKIDHGPWDGASAPRNADTCLAHDESKKGTVREWLYPVIADGHVSAKGVASAAGYASTEGADAIASVAHRLSDEIHRKMHGVSASGERRFILDGGKKLHAAKAVPMALAGLPKEINGQPVHYFKKEIARAGHWTHRGELRLDGTPVEFDITPAQIDTWVENFHKREKNGLRPFLPGEHRATFNAADNHGFVIDMQREGDSAFATLQVIGDKSAEIVAKNDVSIYITDGSVDAYGNKYGEVLEHLSLTPNPNQPHLGPFVKIAASADAPARDVPVYELSASTPAPSRKENTMTPELAKQFREKLGIAADVPDDKLPDLAAQKALALSADVATLTKERDTAKGEVLALSADVKKLDPVTVSMFSENIATKRQMAIESGAITPAEAKAFDALLSQTDGTPTVLALSACGASKRPLGFQLWDAIGKLGNNAVRTGNKLPDSAVPAEPNPYLRLSADGGQEESQEKMIERARKEAEAYRDQQLKNRGIA